MCVCVWGGGFAQRFGRPRVGVRLHGTTVTNGTQRDRHAADAQTGFVEISALNWSHIFYAGPHIACTGWTL